MTKANLDALVAQIALRQCGVYSRAQALALGMTDSSMFRRIRADRWIVLYPGVYLLAGVAPSWHAEIWAAVGRRAARNGDARDVDPAERFAPTSLPGRSR